MKLTVACLFLVTHLGLILENNDFLTFMLSLRGGNYFSPVNSRLAYCHFFAFSDEQYLIEFNCIALGYIQAFNIYGLAGGHLILLAAGLNNSVNLKPPGETFAFYQLGWQYVKYGF